MSYSKNFKTISILFNTTCLLNNFIDLNSFVDLYIWDQYSRLYIDTVDHLSFLNDYKEENITECIINSDFEAVFELFYCQLENTEQIYYLQNNSLVKKPNAWSLDYLNINKDNLYTYETSNKELVELWILDTGINWKHSEFFSGQVIDVDSDFTIANITNPHGTGTSACAGGLNYGSSKGFIIYNYPVCRVGGSCRTSDIDKGFFKVLERLNQTDKRIVVNLSVGVSLGTDPTNTSLGLYYNNILRILTESGAIVVTSAGNSNQDACTWLYSFSPYVISVGALDQNYHKASFSNFGDCVDIWSFGVSVPTAYSTTDNFTVQYKSGTSFSSPLVAGLVANILSQNVQFTRDDVLSILYYKLNGYIVPNYQCGSLDPKCCQSEILGTRKNKYCSSFDLPHCPRSCVIKSCVGI